MLAWMCFLFSFFSDDVSLTQPTGRRGWGVKMTGFCSVFVLCRAQGLRLARGGHVPDGTGALPLSVLLREDKECLATTGLLHRRAGHLYSNLAGQASRRSLFDSEMLFEVLCYFPGWWRWYSTQPLVVGCCWFFPLFFFLFPFFLVFSINDASFLTLLPPPPPPPPPSFF